MHRRITTPCVKITSKWIIHLNGDAKTIKLSEKSIEVNLGNLGLDNGSLDNTESISNK